jgi:hypothetical protein
VEVRRHRPRGDRPTAVAAHPARRGAHSRAPRSPARSTDGPSGERCRARAVRGTCTPMTSWRQFQANRLPQEYRPEDPGRQAHIAPQRPPARAHRRDRDRRFGRQRPLSGLRAAIIADYDAETAVERELVLRLASLLWRLRRIIASRPICFGSSPKSCATAGTRWPRRTVKLRTECLTLAEADRLGCNSPALSPRELAR